MLEYEKWPLHQMCYVYVLIMLFVFLLLFFIADI
jgi:hypothetical protein